MPEMPKNLDEAADGGLRTTALFACPFCGEEAEITDESQPNRPKSWFFAWCKNRPECNSWLAAESPEKVAKKWNKRASPWCDSCKEPDCKVSGDGTCAPMPGCGWLGIESAPKDGTEILIQIHHRNRQYCEEWEKSQWEGNAKARWIDHNGGGWYWLGMSGTPVLWKALHNAEPIRSGGGVTPSADRTPKSP